MIYYDTISEVQAAYLAKAKASESPTQAVKIGGQIKASSTGAKAFSYAESCPIEVTAKVANSYIKDGKVVEGATVSDIDANGVTVGTLKVVSLVDNKNGTWELKYEYTLSDATQEHADAAEVEGGHNSLKAPHEFAVAFAGSL